MEIWKSIIGYEGMYEISNLGRVKSLPRLVKTRYSYLSKEKILIPAKVGSGYLAVSLSKQDKTKTFMIHKLVAEVFISNPSNLPQVNHIDGNKTNNIESNLEWVSISYNSTHAFKLGLKVSHFKPQLKENNPNSKLTIDLVKEIRNKYSTNNYSQRVLAKEYNLTQACIWQIVNNKTWN